tara:strand:+ start:2568 stop:3377 length:810 start_codon:yes stop_codon:yes gene_type:complete
MNKLVKVLEYLVNEEREKASDLLHDVFVEKAKAQWSALSESDESVEEDIQEEDLDETYDADLEEGFGGDMESDFTDDIESDEEEIDAEAIYDDEDMDDEESLDDGEMDMSIDMGEIGGDEMDTAEPAEALANVEDALAELRAAFADLMGDDEAEDEMDMDSEEDEMDMDMDAEELEMEAFGEAAELKSVSVVMKGNDDGKKSPVAKAITQSPTGAKAHPTDTKVGTEAKAPAAKDMGVTGPQDHDIKLKAVAKPTKPDTKGDSLLKAAK